MIPAENLWFLEFSPPHFQCPAGSLQEGVWKAIEYNNIVAFKLAIGAFLTATNKRHCFEKGLTTPFCWSNVNAYRFHSEFIRKRIETKTEQSERGLNHSVCLLQVVNRAKIFIYLFNWPCYSSQGMAHFRLKISPIIKYQNSTHLILKYIGCSARPLVLSIWWESPSLCLSYKFLEGNRLTNE